MEPNVNPETGVRYGIIRSHAIHPEIIDEIETRGTDLTYVVALEGFLKDLVDTLEMYGIRKEAAAELADEAAELFCEAYEHDEPVHSFEIDGVKGQTTWLGGAMLIYVFESPHKTRAQLCSPCVPNCGDLDAVDDDGAECYDVPPEWRFVEE